ncbi:MAG: hypothetical protein DWG77_01830 [Chloroflexi bacterium]|nr:hypothetical protein [Chloroflexota bacterium]
MGSLKREELWDLARDASRRARGSIRRTPGLLVLSGLLAVSLWVFVTDTENPTIIDQFPQPISVEAVNVADNLAVANQLPAVNVRISAPTDRWDDISSTNLRAVVDLNQLDARAQEVTVQVEVSGVGGVRVVDVEPRVITVNLEDLVSRMVPVETRTIGSLPIGYELSEMSPQTTAVTISGPESLVARVAEAVADVNVTGLTVNLDQTVPLKPIGSGGSEILGVRIEPATVRVGVEVFQSTIIRTVPLTVDVTGTPAAGFRVSSVSLSPPAIQVQGPLEASQQIDAIALPVVNVNGARTDIVRSIAVPLPPGLEFVNAERVTVTLTVEAAIGSTLTSVVIEAVGLSGGLQAQASPGAAIVTLEGPLPLLNALVSGDVRATVALGGLGIGSHTVPVTVEVPEWIEVASVQQGTVTVTISQ